jgi:hypothetical protein
MDKEFILQDGKSIDPRGKEPNWEQAFNNVCEEHGERKSGTK